MQLFRMKRRIVIQEAKRLKSSYSGPTIDTSSLFPSFRSSCSADHYSCATAFIFDNQKRQFQVWRVKRANFAIKSFWIWWWKRYHSSSSIYLSLECQPSNVVRRNDCFCLLPVPSPLKTNVNILRSLGVVLFKTDFLSSFTPPSTICRRAAW